MIVLACVIAGFLGFRCGSRLSAPPSPSQPSRKDLETELAASGNPNKSSTKARKGTATGHHELQEEGDDDEAGVTPKQGKARRKERRIPGKASKARKGTTTERQKLQEDDDGDDDDDKGDTQERSKANRKAKPIANGSDSAAISHAGEGAKQDHTPRGPAMEEPVDMV